MISEACGSITTQYTISLVLLILVCLLAIYGLWASSRIESLETRNDWLQKEVDDEFKGLNGWMD